MKYFGYVCFASEPISSVSLVSESTFQNQFIFGTWAKTRKMRISENACVSFCVETVKIRNSDHVDIFDFWGLWGGSRLHPILRGGGLWGGGWQLN